MPQRPRQNEAVDPADIMGCAELKRTGVVEEFLDTVQLLEAPCHHCLRGN